MPIEELLLEGMDFDSFSWRGEVLTAAFGSGYRAKAVVGHVGGLHRWTLSSGCLPDDAVYDNLIADVPRLEYYFNFYRRHTTGENDVFVVQFRGAYYHACFAETEMTMEVFTLDLFGGGVEIKQARLVGSGYHTDGSLDVTPPLTPGPFTVIDAEDTPLIHLEWTAVTDPDDSGVDGGTSEFDEDSVIDGGDAGG